MRPLEETIHDQEQRQSFLGTSLALGLSLMDESDRRGSILSLSAKHGQFTGPRLMIKETRNRFSISMLIRTVVTENLGVDKPTVHLLFADRQGSDQLILHPPEGYLPRAVIISPMDLFAQYFRPDPRKVSRAPQNSPTPVEMEMDDKRPGQVFGNIGPNRPTLQVPPQDQQTRVRGARSVSLPKDALRRPALAQALGDRYRLSANLRFLTAKRSSQTPKPR